MCIRDRRPLFLAGSATFRARLPGIVSRQGPQFGVWAVWIYHALITPRLVAAAHGVGIQVIAWTVDDAARVAELRALGVDGIVSNDPRLLNGGPSPARPAASPPDERESLI